MAKAKKDRNVSWSEISAWCTCREKWHWIYGVGIVPVRKERAPSIGSCGHAAIAAILLGNDWKKAVSDWLKAEIGDRELFDEELEQYQEVHDLVHAIIPRYIEHYETDKHPAAKFEPVLVEHRFEIPIRGITVQLMGFWDALVRGSDGHLWLLEHKFPGRFRAEEDLELDGQIGVYQYAARRLGYNVVGTVYNQILARVPAIPKINKDGSLSRAKIYTDWETYSGFATEQGLDPADYLEMEEKLFDFKFFQRSYLYRPKIEIQAFARDMERRIWDMRKSKKHIYRNESFTTCGRCPYRELCLESLKGGDIDYIIENNFEPKKPRREPEPGYKELDDWTTKEGDK